MRYASRLALIGPMSLLLLAGSLRGADGEYTTSRSYEEFLELVEAVQTHALSPPTRQEMLARAITASDPANAPDDLAVRLSNAGSREEEKQILADCFAGVQWTKSLRERFIRGAVQWTSSVVSIEPVSELDLSR